jgi:hypothetical protein
MSNTRGGLGRIVALGIGLALALLLLGAKEAGAGRYSVAQCGWHIGADASWADSTGGAKFRPSSYCAAPPGADPFDGVHLKSFTREDQGTVSGTRYARWRWDAPAGTGITRVSGTWWHALRDGIEQRIGVANWNGGFDVFATAGSTDTTPRSFVAGFDPAQPAIEDRLLCARVESKWCSLSPGSWSAIRALTITVQDDYPPGSWIGGELLTGGWQRGIRKLEYAATDVGAGLRRTEVLFDGVSVFPHDHPCNAVLIGSELRGTTMRPCPTDRVGYYPLTTNGFSDGPHAVSHCATDFAGNPNCLPARTVLIDNNPPVHPRSPALVGGDAWRRNNDFDLTWVNPDQGVASPIGGAIWRIKGPADYATPAKFVSGRDLSALRDLFVPRAGIFQAELWLRDEAGNEAPGSAVSVPLRFDDVPPGVAFEAGPASGEVPELIRARIVDSHAGPANGEIHYRRLDGKDWLELPAKLQRENSADAALLLARLPADLAPGTYVFRVEALDAAGNAASSSRRADGVEMTVRKIAQGAAAEAAKPVTSSGTKTRIFARLHWRGRSGTQLTVPFRVAATLHGRLLDADGAGLGGRTLRVVERPSRGALRKARVETIATGRHGGFQLQLPPGPSRRIAVSFRGEARLDGATRRPLTLRVRGGIDLQALPRVLRTGEAIRFRGRVRTLGAPLPRRGKLVAIQYFEQATRRWRPTLVTRTDHSGRFRASYRFRYVSGVASIRLRAMALAEEHWPYAPGASRPIAVRVTG